MLESTIVRILSKTLMQTGGIVDESLYSDNAIRSMVTAGSKGNPINLSQICGLVGQQSIEGRRVFAEKGGRTPPMLLGIREDALGARLLPELVQLGAATARILFHSMGGREGLVDTAVKTATTGYIQRRQIKSMEDTRIAYDGTVRNAEDGIVDFSYGGDGMDASKVERVALPILEEADDSIEARMTPWEAKHALRAKRNILLCRRNLFVTTLDTRVLLPFNPTRITMKLMTATRENVTSAATPDELAPLVQGIVERLQSRVLLLAVLDFFCVSRLVSYGVSLDMAAKTFEDIERNIAFCSRLSR